MIFPLEGNTGMSGIARLRRFVEGMTALADSGADDARFLSEGAPLLRELIAQDDWLPEGFDEATEAPGYRQRLLYCDPKGRFSVVCFTWGIGARTPVHDHLTWGMVGQLRGEETSNEMIVGAPGTPLRHGRVDRLRTGEVAAISPEKPGYYDIHYVENALPSRTSISIHVYGTNIGALPRHVFDEATSERRAFVSGYDNAFVPNLWFGQPAAA